MLLTDLTAHIPHEALSKNLGVSKKALDGLPDRGRFIFSVGGARSPPEGSARRCRNCAPQHTILYFARTNPAGVKHTRGGHARIVDSATFKVSTTVAAALVTVHSGGLREVRWHPDAGEWQYYISGNGRMTVFAGGGRARTLDFETGDVGYVLKTLPHYIENTAPPRSRGASFGALTGL